MENFSSSDKVIAYLSSKKYNYTSEKAINQACKDGKTFIQLLKDLLFEIQPSFFRVWMITQGHTQFEDSQKNRLSLPVLQDYVIVKKMLSELVVNQFPVSLLNRTSNKSVIPLLSKIVHFLEAKSKILKESEHQFIENKALKNQLKKHHQNFELITQRAKAIEQQKQNERPLFQQKQKVLNQVLIQTAQIQKQYEEQTSTNSIKNQQLSTLREKLQQKRKRTEADELKVNRLKGEVSKIRHQRIIQSQMNTKNQLSSRFEKLKKICEPLKLLLDDKSKNLKKQVDNVALSKQNAYKWLTQMQELNQEIKNKNLSISRIQMNLQHLNRQIQSEQTKFRQVQPREKDKGSHIDTKRKSYKKLKSEHDQMKKKIFNAEQLISEQIEVGSKTLEKVKKSQISFLKLVQMRQNIMADIERQQNQWIKTVIHKLQQSHELIDNLYK